MFLPKDEGASVSSRRDCRSAACTWHSKQRTAYPTWQLAQCQQQLGRHTWGRLPTSDNDSCQPMLTQQLNPPFSKENAEVPAPARPAGIKSELTLLRLIHLKTKRAGPMTKPAWQACSAMASSATCCSMDGAAQCKVTACRLIVALLDPSPHLQGRSP